MVLQKIILENITTHSYSEFQLEPEVNLILGPNGSGKSSIARAIGLCLFDELSGSHGDFISAGKTYGVITISFSHQGLLYQITRQIGQGASWIVVEDGYQVAKGKEEVTEFLKNLYRCHTHPGQLWQACIGTSQFGLGWFDLTPAVRRGQFNDLFGISEWDKVDSGLKEPLREIAHRSDNCAQAVAILQKMVDEYGDAASKRVDDISREINSFSRKRDDLLSEIQKTRWEISGSRRDVLVREIGQREESIADQERAKVCFDDLENLQTELAKQEEYLDILGRMAVSQKRLEYLKESNLCPICGTVLSPPRQLELISQLEDQIEEDGNYVGWHLNKDQIRKKQEEVTYRINLAKTFISDDWLVDNKNRLSELKERLQSEPDLKVLYQALGVLEGQLSAVRQRLAVLPGIHQKAMDQVSKVDEHKEAIVRNNEEIAELHLALEILKEIREKFKKIGPAIAQEIRDTISSEATSTVSHLKSWSIAMADDYGLVISKSNGQVDFSQLSGGEQMLCSLVTRLSMARTLASVGFMVFDEPTTGLDETTRQEVASLLSSQAEQTIIITHDTSFSGSNVIEL